MAVVRSQRVKVHTSKGRVLEVDHIDIGRQASPYKFPDEQIMLVEVVPGARNKVAAQLHTAQSDSMVS